MAIFPGLLYYVLGKKEIRQVESSPVKGLFCTGLVVRFLFFADSSPSTSLVFISCTPFNNLPSLQRRQLLSQSILAIKKNRSELLRLS